jgi:hypothetical protein
MRTTPSDLPEKHGRQFVRPRSDLSLGTIGLILVIYFCAWAVWDFSYTPSNEELRRAYQQGFEAALDTKRVKPELEGACLTLWWGQNVRTTD